MKKEKGKSKETRGQEYSMSPDGRKFALPREADYAAERERLDSFVLEKRREGYEVVVVVGLGFVGAVMAAVIADSVDKNNGMPGKFVIGMQRPSTRSYWKTPLINLGESPIKAEDPEVDELIRRTVLEKKTMIATFSNDALKFADVIVVDVQCDYIKEELGHLRHGRVAMEALESSMRTIAENMRPEALVLIETTVAPGTTEQVALPIMKKAFVERGIKSEPLLAHSYERVMPGRNYVKSIRDFWRVCSGVDEVSKRRVKKFLSEVLNVEDFPLTVLDRPIESETAKIVENSFRASILAFMDEWTRFAERHGVDIAKVIAAIRVRPTHSNLMLPGPGIGGYCLPKDGGLGLWAHQNILKDDEDIFKITPTAIDINDTRGLHAADMIADTLKAMGKDVQGAKVLVAGASYREDVGDTRYSGSEVVVRRLAHLGAKVYAHDPYVDHWWEFENQDTYPYPGHSLARFFDNQEGLKDLKVQNDLAAALDSMDAVFFAVRHEPYLKLKPEDVVKWAGGPLAVIDGFAILADDHIRRFLEMGCEVAGLGRGHIGRIKQEIKAKTKKKA
jgi:UDP-N-acetyl-D-glucosamine dehydrogenase